MQADFRIARGDKPALSVAEMERVLVAAAQNFPETSDVVDVSIEVRQGDWYVKSHAPRRSGAAEGRMCDVAERLRRVFQVVG